MKILTTIVFLATYALISGSRLRLLPIGRLGGAIAGAVLMVAIGAISPEATYAAINHDTILLLFAMMFLSVYLEKVGLFDLIGQRLMLNAVTPGRLLIAVGLISGLGSAFLVNDTVCIFLTPVVIATCRRTRLPFAPYLLAIATSANIGSAATPVGNPQNMIIASVGKLSFTTFAERATLPALVGLAINLGLLWLYYRRELERSEVPEGSGPAIAASLGRHERSTSVLMAIREDKRLPLALVVLAGVAAGFLAGLHLGYTALTGALVFLLLERRDPRPILEKLDWPMLVFFVSLFIVIAAFARTGIVDAVWQALAPTLDLSSARGLAAFSALMLAGSNLVSNVPMVLLAAPHLQTHGQGALGWVLLGFVTTVAGNLTLVGSVANIIVAEGAREDYILGFREYLRFGVVSTLLVLGVGVPLTALICRLLPGS